MVKNTDHPHQDWEPVVLRKTAQQLKQQNPANKTTVLKYKQANSNKLEGKKIVDDDGDVHPQEKISHDLKIQIQQARTAKKISQKDFAAQLGTTVAIIKEYENGKAVPNKAFLSKMERTLGVKFKR